MTRSYSSLLRGVAMVRDRCSSCGLRSRRMHLTAMDLDFGEVGRIEGMYPLCQPCWLELIPRDRLPHYRRMWLERNPGPQDLGQWFEIEAAVLAELPSAAHDQVRWGTDA